MFQDCGMTALLFQALQMYWEELTPSRVAALPSPARKPVDRMKQFLVFSGGVMIAVGVKLGGQRHLNPGWK